ncbi:hypothetical protein FGO68_gene15605 [Halteria grandinella]|uniref:LIM zinc-binding domain-containing protein n=1 Tax=Halteria grandinella TaxID=5974 RepID=A0A8J8NZY6_HALGN|nr:hypothetical protein FGO68_gene15605 [Halteria grandinella]
MNQDSIEDIDIGFLINPQLNSKEPKKGEAKQISVVKLKPFNALEEKELPQPPEPVLPVMDQWSCLLAVLSELAYAAEKRDEEGLNTRQKINQALAQCAQRFPGLAKELSEYEIELSNIDMFCLVKAEEKKAIISIKGSQEWEQIKDNMAKTSPLMREVILKKSDIEHLKLPQKFIQTLIFVKEIQKLFSDYQITLTGHSLGGTYADLVAMHLNLNCETFNSCTNDVNKMLFKKKGKYFVKIKQHHIVNDKFSENDGPGIRINYEIQGDPSRSMSDFLNIVESQPFNKIAIPASYFRKPSNHDISSSDEEDDRRNQDSPLEQDQVLPGNSQNPQSPSAIIPIKKNPSKLPQVSKSAQPLHGGVDFNTMKYVEKILSRQKKLSPIDFTKQIKGVYLNAKDNICSFVTYDNEEEYIEDGIDLNDLAVALYVFCNSEIKSKSLSFSLDALDKKNPEGDWQKKVVYPDAHEESGKTFIAGTEFTEIMFEADWLMKQLSMGVEVIWMDPLTLKDFEYDQVLKDLGLNARHYFKTDEEEKNRDTSDLDWCRFWFVVKQVKLKSLDKPSAEQRFFEIEDIKLGIESRQLEKDHEGVLHDAVCQDPNKGNYKFAAKFSEIIDVLEEMYPIFKRLKQQAKAVVLAQWIYLNNIPIDINKVKEIVENQRVKNYKEVVPRLKYEFVTVKEKEKSRSTHTRSVMGGVNTQLSFSQLIDEDQKSNWNLSNEKTKPIEVQKTTLKRVNSEEILLENPFSPKSVCSKCQCTLSLQEKIHTHKKKLYCDKHHPMICAGCHENISSEYTTYQKQRYHKECFICFSCMKPINESFYTKEGLFYLHKSCYDNFEADMMRHSSDTISQASEETKESDTSKKSIFSASKPLAPSASQNIKLGSVQQQLRLDSKPNITPLKLNPLGSSALGPSPSMKGKGLLNPMEDNFSQPIPAKSPYKPYMGFGKPMTKGGKLAPLTNPLATKLEGAGYASVPSTVKSKGSTKYPLVPQPVNRK